MKLRDQRRQFNELSLVELQKAVFELERNITREAMSIRLGKSKQVSTLKNQEKQLARMLTIAQQKITQSIKE